MKWIAAAVIAAVAAVAWGVVQHDRADAHRDLNLAAEAAYSQSGATADTSVESIEAEWRAVVGEFCRSASSSDGVGGATLDMLRETSKFITDDFAGAPVVNAVREIGGAVQVEDLATGHVLPADALEGLTTYSSTFVDGGAVLKAFQGVEVCSVL